MWLIRSKLICEGSHTLIRPGQEPIKSFSSYPESACTAVLLEDIIAKVDCMVLFSMCPDRLHILIKRKYRHISSQLAPLRIQSWVLRPIPVLSSFLSILLHLNATIHRLNPFSILQNLIFSSFALIFTIQFNLTLAIPLTFTVFPILLCLFSSIMLDQFFLDPFELTFILFNMLFIVIILLLFIGLDQFG